MKQFLASLAFLSIFLVPYSFANTSINNNEASVYDFNNIPLHQLTDKIGMRFFTSPQCTVIQWILKPGAKLPIHSHMNEQITRVERGELLVDSEGKNYHLSTGQIMVFPSYIKHGFTAQTDTIIYELQTPIRQDFLEPDFIHKLSDYLSKNQ